MRIDVCKLGLIDYKEALELQYKLVEARQKDRIPNTLLLLEHPPVLTKGTRTDATNIYLTEDQLHDAGISVYEVNRGGDVTYHGPGQIVGYPIYNLKEYEPGIRDFINTMQEAIISYLDESFAIKAYSQKNKMTGVWVNEKKITAFGLAVMQGVTMHGFAMNINTNLSHFELINPCGLNKGVTSVAEELGTLADMEQAFEGILEHLAKHFNWQTNRVNLPQLKERIRAEKS